VAHERRTAVDGVAGVAADLRGSGVEIVWEATHAGCKGAFVRDNTGDLVELMQRVARAENQQKEAESR